METKRALVEATRKQIVEKMEARMEIATTEAADLAAKQFMAELHWIERERAEHVKRAVRMANAASAESKNCGTRMQSLKRGQRALLP